ncbi:MAG TPA: hypothetical protein VNR68_05760 [Sphingomicrobium sp.]|nr:hypothetical protein [Sphingomicrobium sp.]
MRALLTLVPLLIAAAPAPAAPDSAQSAARAMDGVDRALNDPRTMDRITKSIQTMTDAFMKLPVGELEAAVEGRSATAADKRRTVRDLGKADDPNFEADVRRQVAQAKPMIEQSMKAFRASLPSMIKSFEEAGKAIERAQANMPTPGYPKR